MSGERNPRLGQRGLRTLCLLPAPGPEQPFHVKTNASTSHTRKCLLPAFTQVFHLSSHLNLLYPFHSGAWRATASEAIVPKYHTPKWDFFEDPRRINFSDFSSKQGLQGKLHFQFVGHRFHDVPLRLTAVCLKIVKWKRTEQYGFCTE